MVAHQTFMPLPITSDFTPSLWFMGTTHDNKVGTVVRREIVARSRNHCGQEKVTVPSLCVVDKRRCQKCID
jgi:hypothetical protein